MDILEIFKSSFHDLWEDLWTTALCNLIWLFSVLLVIPGPPATLALFYYTNRLARGEVADIGDFFGAFRRSWGIGWRWGLVNAALLAILWGDFILTGRLSQSSMARFVQGFYLAALGAWFIVQLFALPFLIEQETTSLRLALRNAAMMLGRNPGFSAVLGITLVCVLFIGTVLFMLSVAAGGMLVAAVGNHAVLNRLEAHRAETH